MDKSKIYYIAFSTILRKETSRIIRTWTQTLLPSAITMTLYFVIFGNLIGSRIADIQGFHYIQYIAPGLIMMAVINNAYSHVAFSVFMSRFQRNIEEILVAPIPNTIFLLAFVTGGVLRSLVVGLLVTLLALCFTHLQMHSILVTAIVVFLSALLFAVAGFINGLLAKNFDDVAFIPTFVLTPLTYLGGVFYSIHFLPTFWQKISLFNPILYIVNAFRYGILGITDIPLALALGILVVCCLGLFITTLYMLKKGVGIKT